MEHRHVEELVDGGGLPGFQGLMQARDEGEQVASESNRPVIAWIMAAVRLSETI